MWPDRATEQRVSPRSVCQLPMFPAAARSPRFNSEWYGTKKSSHSDGGTEKPCPPLNVMFCTVIKLPLNIKMKSRLSVSITTKGGRNHLT